MTDPNHEEAFLCSGVDTTIVPYTEFVQSSEFSGEGFPLMALGGQQPLDLLHNSHCCSATELPQIPCDGGLILNLCGQGVSVAQPRR